MADSCPSMACVILRVPAIIASESLRKRQRSMTTSAAHVMARRRPNQGTLRLSGPRRGVAGGSGLSYSSNIVLP